MISSKIFEIKILNLTTKPSFKYATSLDINYVDFFNFQSVLLAISQAGGRILAYPCSGARNPGLLRLDPGPINRQVGPRTYKCEPGLHKLDPGTRTHKSPSVGPRIRNL